MSRYVDAEYIKAVMINDRLMQGNAEFNLYAQQVEIQVKALPSIDIVRCKECKYWHDHITTTWCSRGAELRPQESGWVRRDVDDYCSYGERKESE